jgi:polyisoprenoid-binding protein YceI
MTKEKILMKRMTSIAVLVLVLGMGIVGYAVLRTPEEASETQIEAVPLQIAATEAPQATDEPEAEEPTATAVEPQPEPVAATDPTAEPEPTAATDEEPAPASELIIYEIDSSASQVRFELDEDLRGVRTTVVGSTDQIAAQLAVNYGDLSTVQVGEIRINARTLATENNMRNRAISNQILVTGAYEFITFVPTAVNDLPTNVNIGDTVTFTIVGDLTITDVTQEATFEVTATAVSATQISGTASTTVTRGDYNLIIPSVPSVANVEDEVDLHIDFVANAVEG